MHAKRTTFAAPLLGSLALAMLLGTFAAAEEPERETYDRYRPALQKLVDDLKVAQARYEAEYVGKVTDDQDHPFTREQVLSTLLSDQERVASALSDLEKSRKDLNDRKITLTSFFDAARSAMESAAHAAADANANEAALRVQRISRDLARKAWENCQAFEKTQSAIGQSMTYDSDEYNAAVEKARAAAAKNERPWVDQAIKDWTATAKAFLARRRALAGEVWRLEDFHQRRDQKEEAKFFRTLVFKVHGYHLGETWGTADVSDLDLFVDFPGSKDRLIVMEYFCKDPQTLFLFGELVRQEPVETLRQFDTTLPPLSFQGPAEEQLARTLSARLVRFYQLQARDDQYRKRLEELVTAAQGLPESLPDLAPLQLALKQYGNIMQIEKDEEQGRKDAEKKVSDGEEWVRKKQAALEEKRKGLLIDPYDRIVAVQDKKSRSAADRMSQLQRQIAAEEKLANEVDDKDQKAGHAAIAKRFQEKLAALDAAVKKECEKEQAAYDKAVEDLDHARQDLARLPKKGESPLPKLWVEILQAYASAVNAIPEAEWKGLPQLPAKGDAADLDVANKAVATLAARIEDLGKRRAATRKEILEVYGELQRTEAEIGLLAKHIQTLRIDAAVTASNALTQLGARPDDEVVKAAEELIKKLRKAQEVLGYGDKGLELLGKVDELKKLAEGAKDRLGLVSKVLKWVGVASDTALAVNETYQALGDDRRALPALSKLLKVAANAGEFIPVVGPTFGRFLGWYAESAGACGEAIVKIQDKLAQTDIANLSKDASPDLHLWTKTEVDNGCSRENQEFRERVRTVLQARRLVFLAKADNESQARGK